MIVQLLFLICLIWVLWQRNAKKSILLPPALSGKMPIIGHGWKVLGDRKHAFKVLEWMSKESLEKGGVVTLKLGPREVYLLSNPEDCAMVSNACLNKDYFYDFARPFVGNGLTTANGLVWKTHRKYMAPAFRQTVLNGFLGVFNHQARRLVSQLKSEVGKGPFDHEKYVRLNSLESICMTSFGADVADLGGLHIQYLEGVNDILNVFTERFQKFWLHSDFMYNWSNLKAKQDKLVRKITKFSGAILEKRKADMKENTILDEPGQFTPFMNLIIELSKETGTYSYSDEDILCETNTIVGGGYDTSACTTILALMLLGSHPEVQKKAYEELQDVFMDSDRDTDKDDLPKLVYLEAVLMETLRLYPIAPIVARCTTKDVKLQNYTLKAGNDVAMLYWALHRHAVWGPDAEQFRPERWLNGSLPSSNAYGGFSMGKRGCIGKTYALMTMKTTLSHVLRSYIITSDMSKLELEINTLLKPNCGRISIEERRQTKPLELTQAKTYLSMKN